MYCQRGEIQVFILGFNVSFEIIVGEIVVKSPYGYYTLSANSVKFVISLPSLQKRLKSSPQYILEGGNGG